MAKKKHASSFLLFYGAVLLIGSFLGHLKASSRVSLIAGIASGLIVIVAAVASYKGRSWGRIIGFIATFFLFVFFLYRYFLTFNFLPAGLMSLFSLATLFLSLKEREVEKV